MSDAQDEVGGMDTSGVPVTPEMHFSDFDPIEAARLAEEFGCMILRGDDTCRAFAESLRQSALAVNVLSETGAPPRSGALWALESDISDMQHLPYKFFQNPKIYAFLRAYFQHDYLMTTNSSASTVRSVFPEFDMAKSNAVKFHQDRAPLELIPFLAFWMHIDPQECGDTAPGLAVVPGYRDGWQQHGKDEGFDYFVMENSDEVMQRAEVPVLQLGDMVIFDPHCPHSTHITEEMTNTRTSVDFRVWKYMTRGGHSLKISNLHPIVLNDRHMIAPRSMVGEGFGRNLPATSLAEIPLELVYDVYSSEPGAVPDDGEAMVEKLFLRLENTHYQTGEFEAANAYTRAAARPDTCRVRFITMVEDMIERGVLEGVVSMVFDAEGNLVTAAETHPSAPSGPVATGAAWAFVFTPGPDDPASGTVTEFGEAGKVEFPLVAARDSFGNFLGLVSPDSGSPARAAAE